MSNLRIVLDTNVILSSLSFRSKYRHIIDELMNGTYDKFSDCAVAAGVHYLVTDDKHFNTLIKLGFPKVYLIKIKDFSDFLKNKA